MMLFFKQAANLCGAAYHSWRYENRFLERAQRKMTNSIAGKLGIQTDHPVNDMSGSGLGYGGGFNIPTQVSSSATASNANEDSIATFEETDDVSSLDGLV